VVFRRFRGRRGSLGRKRGCFREFETKRGVFLAIDLSYDYQKRLRMVVDTLRPKATIA